MGHVYKVATAVEYVRHDRYGREERFYFPKGHVEHPTEDELFVLERALAPAGMAVRVVQKNPQETK